MMRSWSGSIQTDHQLEHASLIQHTPSYSLKAKPLGLDMTVRQRTHLQSEPRDRGIENPHMHQQTALEH